MRSPETRSCRGCSPRCRIGSGRCSATRDGFALRRTRHSCKFERRSRSARSESAIWKARRGTVPKSSSRSVRCWWSARRRSKPGIGRECDCRPAARRDFMTKRQELEALVAERQRDVERARAVCDALESARQEHEAAAAATPGFEEEVQVAVERNRRPSRPPGRLANIFVRARTARESTDQLAASARRVKVVSSADAERRRRRPERRPPPRPLRRPTNSGRSKLKPNRHGRRSNRPVMRWSSPKGDFG